MFNRIISFLVVIAIVFSVLPFSVSAGELVVAGETAYAITTIFEILSDGYDALESMSDYFDKVGLTDSLAEETNMYCSSAEEETDGSYICHYFTGGLLPSSQSCKYCGLSLSAFRSSCFESAEDDYVSDLDYTVVDDKGLFEYYPNGWHYATSVLDYMSSDSLNSYNGGYEVSGNLLASLDKYSYFCQVDSDSFSLPPGLYEFYFDSASGERSARSASYGWFDTLILQGKNESDSSWTEIYKFSIYSRSDLPTSYTVSTVDHSYDSYRLRSYFYCYAKRTSGSDVSGSRYGHIECLGLQDGSALESDSSDRMSSLTQSISKYNSGNNWVDNSTVVNYFIGNVGDDGTVSDIYDIALYDEETLVFTEPVTGAQYQTTGWTYDYTTRSYDISLAAGTFAIGDTDITRVLLIYADDAVYIGYYDASGNQIQVDTFPYVMVSQSECSLYGHTYTVETLTEATCNSVGERMYTCSVCGDQRVEDIPMKWCTTTYSVFKEPTCTTNGIALYTCTECGTQFTETIEAPGHDWVETDAQDTVYSLPDGTSCPDCDSADFACQLDEPSKTYSCTCNSCGSSWTTSAEVSTGYTVYICSVCGVKKTESDSDSDGLFNSVGSFIADGITWCTDKLSQLVDNLTSILDTYDSYLEIISEQNSSFPSFLSQVVTLLPEDLMAVIWFFVVAFVVVAVIKVWFR